MKKLWLEILCVILAVTACLCLLAGCDKKNPDPNKKPPSNDNPNTPVTVDISQSTLQLKLFEKATLRATVSGSSDGVIWSSSDTDIVTVTDGVVYGKAEGEATVTAKVGNVSDTCRVTVTDTGAVPVLDVDREKVEIVTSGKIYVNAVVTLDGIDVPADMEWSSEDPAVAQVEQTEHGALVTGVSVGSTVITVRTNVRGSALAATVEVVVKDAVHFEIKNLKSVNGIYVCDLYATEPTKEYEGKSSFSLAFDLSRLGDALSQDGIVLEEEPGKHLLNIVGTKLTAVKAGETTVYVKYTSDAGILYCLQINVNVLLPTVQLGDDSVRINKSAETISFPTPAGVNGDVTSVTVNGTELFARLDGNTVYLDKTAVSKVRGGNREIILTTDAAEYHFNGLFITYIITTKEELDNFPTLAYAENPEEYVWDGYFVLGNDIAYNGVFNGFCNYTQCGSYLSASADKLGFIGTFDGQGYTIDGISFGNPVASEGSSLISLLGRGGVVRNLALTNVRQTAAGGAVVSNCYGTVENVFVEGTIEFTYTWNDNKSTLLVSYVHDGATVKNCVAILSGIGSSVSSDAAKAAAIEVAIKTADDGAVISNVHAVGVCAERSTIAGVAHYDTLADLAAAKAGIAGQFGAGWDVSDSVKIPMLAKMRNAIEKQLEAFINARLSSIAYPGSAYEIPSKLYMALQSTSLPTGVSISDGILTIANTAGEMTFSLVFASDFYNDLTVTKTIAVKLVTTVSGDFCDVDLSAQDGATIDLADITSDNCSTAFVPGTNVISLFIDGVDMAGKYLRDGDVITIARADLDGFGAGIHDLLIITDTCAYKTKLTLATMFIDTWEKFVSFPSYAEKATSTSWGGYFIVTKDIDGGGQSFYAFCNWYYCGASETTGFVGTFDGRGHTISNFTTANRPEAPTNGSNSHTSIFSHIGKTGVIKNIAFTNVTKPGTASLLASVCYGTIENVFVSGSLMGAGAGSDRSTMLVTDLKAGATVKNCVVYMKYIAGAIMSDSNIGLLYATKEDGVTIENVHAISDDTSTTLVTGSAEATVNGATRYDTPGDFKAAAGELDLDGIPVPEELLHV